MLRLLAFLCFALCVALVPAPAWADGSRRIEVSAAGDRDTTRALQTGLLELLDEQGVELDWSFKRAIHPKQVLAVGAHDSALLARIWLDVRATDRAVLYIADTTNDRFLLRVVPLEAGYDEVARESLGNIVESAIDALLAGADFGVSREALERQVAQEIGPVEPEPAPAPVPKHEPKTPSSAEVPPAKSPSPWLPAAIVGYRVEGTKRTELVRHGPELGAVLWQQPDRFGGFFAISAGYRVPTRWTGEGVKLQMQGMGARLLFGLGSPRHTWSWRLALAAGTEAIRVATDVTDVALSAREPSWQVAPTLGALASAELRLHSSWGLLLGAGAEHDLLGHHFDVLRAGQAVPILEPWGVRPVGWLALAWNRR